MARLSKWQRERLTTLPDEIKDMDLKTLIAHCRDAAQQEADEQADWDYDHLEADVYFKELSRRLGFEWPEDWVTLL